MAWTKRILQPSALLPVALSGGALAAAFSISNIDEV